MPRSRIVFRDIQFSQRFKVDDEIEILNQFKRHFMNHQNDSELSRNLKILF